MAEELRLPPFPNDLIARGEKTEAINFLARLGLPAYYAKMHLKRFGAYLGIRITRDDLTALSWPPDKPQTVAWKERRR